MKGASHMGVFSNTGRHYRNLILAALLQIDLKFESDISHKFTKCPGHCDLDHWPNSSVLDS